MESVIVQTHLRLLLELNIASRLLIVVLVFLSAHLPLFDSSPTLVPCPKWLLPLLRWDAFHFSHLAFMKLQYKYEYEWAFFPGTSIVMNAPTLLGLPSWHTLMLGGAGTALMCDSTKTLYLLSLHHLKSPYIAFLTSVLSLLPASPATLRFATYSEPFFTALSYKGMLACARHQWFGAACYFMLAGVFRSNGILLVLFPVWGLIMEPLIHERRLPSVKTISYSLLLTSMIFLPFLYHHYAAYLAFCRPHSALDAATPGWCNKFPPSIYTHVQSTYWHVGFLSYWTVAQIPNFLLASPILALLISYSDTCLVRHMKNVFTEPSQTSVSFTVDPPASMLPHAIHALILSFTLLFASHVQIALRLASSMPIVYWAAAALIVRRVDGNKRTTSAWSWGYAWVSWSVIWGAVSVVLWTVFLPPA